MLPAREGDALWIRWGADGPAHQAVSPVLAVLTPTKLPLRFVKSFREWIYFVILSED